MCTWRDIGEEGELSYSFPGIEQRMQQLCLEVRARQVDASQIASASGQDCRLYGFTILAEHLLSSL